MDKRINEAVERAGQWLDAGDSDHMLAIDPIFELLSGRPEYQDLLARNAQQVERQQQIYLAGRDAGSVQNAASP